MIQADHIEAQDAWLPPLEVEIVPATLEHARAISADLRPMDLPCGRNATESVANCLSVSRSAWAATDEAGRVICMWGLVCPSLLGARAEIWLLASRRVEDYLVRFARQARDFVAEMQHQYPRLEANVAASNHVAVRFVRWLGFRPCGEFTIDGHRFLSFERAPGEA